MSPQVLNQLLDHTRTLVLIFPPFEHQPNYLKEEPKTQGSPRDPRGLNVLAHPNGSIRAARGSSERRHLLIPSGPVSLPPPSRRWKVRKHSIRHVPSRDPAVSVPPDKVHYVTGIQIAGEAQPPANGGNRAVGPSRDSTVVAIDASHSMSDGGGLALPALIMTERHRWTGKPHTETFSALTHQTPGLCRPASRPLRPSPGPSIAIPLPTDRTET